MRRSSMRSSDWRSTPAMAAAIRRRAVPNAPAAAQAEPPPGVGDAEAKAARTSFNGLSANATDQLSHCIGGDAVEGQPLPAAALAAENPDGTPGQTAETGKIANELVVGRAVNRRRREPDEHGVVSLAVDRGGLRAGDDANIALSAGRCRSDQPARNASTLSSRSR